DRGEEEAPTRQPACDRPLIRPGIVPEAVRLLVAPPPIPRRLGAGGFRTLGCGRRPRLALLTLLRAAILHRFACGRRRAFPGDDLVKRSPGRSGILRHDEPSNVRGQMHSRCSVWLPNL